MTRPSRRAVIAVGIALPAAVVTKPAAAFPVRQSATPDPLVARAAEWVSLSQHVDTLSLEADDLQGVVFDRAKALGVKSDKACRSSMPEAKAWRAKKREYEEGCRSLEALAREIRGSRATSTAGAVAKIELSLHLQYEEWSEHAFELIEDGVAELRDLTANTTEHR